MSNGKEVVSITRETAKQAAHLLAAHSTGPSLERDTAEELLDALEKQAEQHQGEPVAWRYKTRVYVQALGHVWREVIETEAPNLNEVGVRDLIPLYTHADPSDIRVTRQALESLKGEASDLRAQLAERGAQLQLAKKLLRQTLASLNPRNRLATYIRGFLKTASAEPSAPDCSTCNDEGAVGNILDTVPCPDCAAAPPVELDERAVFDPIEWLEIEISAVDTWYRGSPSYERDAGWMKDQALRLVSEARAALERKP